MKTSITIKETKQTLANKPKSYADYINTLNADMQKADRIGGIKLAQALTEAKAHIDNCEWEEYKNITQFTEDTLTIKKARVSQLVKGYELIAKLYDYLHEECESETEQQAIQEIMDIYTISHYYELKDIEPNDIGTYAESGFITPEMTVAELRKFVASLNEEDEDEDEDSNDTDNETDDTDENTLEIRNVDDAETLYKDILKKLERGEILTIKIATV